MLIAIYENPDVSYDTYSLTQLLNPKLSPSSSEYEKAFKSTLKAIERLIVVVLWMGSN